MSQDIFSSIDPVISGSDLALVLNDFKDAMVSGMSGTSRPTELDPGGMWVDTTLDPASWSLKLWTGTVDIEIVKIDLSLGVATSSLAVDSFSVRKVSADSAGAIMNLVKRRVASNGQVAASDVVGEIRIIGRTNSSTDPVVGKLIWTAGEAQTTTTFGGTLSFYSTPAGTNTLLEHLRFAAGQIESVVAHKLNAIILAAQSVATTATINQLDGSKTVVEMTGTTATEIRGINSGQASKVVTVHARTSGAGAITFKHESASATAVDRFTLPNARDLTIPAQASATFFYSVADSRWKLQYKSADFSGFTTARILPSGSWLAPANVAQVRIVASRNTVPPGAVGFESYHRLFKNITGESFSWGNNTYGGLGLGDITSRSSPVLVLGGKAFSRIITDGSSSFGVALNGALYAWGRNAQGQLGLGDVVSRSSPVAVLGGLTFSQVQSCNTGTGGGTSSALGISSSGALYSWGYNSNGQLGLGDVAVRSSPVAVLGGLTFQKVLAVSGGGVSTYGLTSDGTLYAWGYNASGQLGVGDVTPRSSPIAVLGGLKFSDISIIGSGSGSVLGLSQSGALYSWGLNSKGQLGLGDVTPRSSPVAVLGGLTFTKIWARADSSYALTAAGVLYGWGSNASGRLGVGDTTSRSSPVAVLGGLVVKDISPHTDGFHVLALTSAGALYSWGLNNNGQLGLGDVVPRSSPVAVLGGLSCAALLPSGQGNMSGAVTTAGAQYAWGENSFGALGVGDITPRSSPVAVLGGLVMYLPATTRAMFDITVTPGNTYTFSAAVEKCFFGSLALPDNTEYLDLEYVVPT